MVKVLVLFYSNTGRLAPMGPITSAFEVFILEGRRRKKTCTRLRTVSMPSVFLWTLFGKQKRRVYDEKEGVRTVREALYGALSGNYVMPLRVKPEARKSIPWRSRVSFRTGARCRY